ncbi:hypothetical protein BUY64_12820, partial [Staphylococcus epidermidis]
GVAQGCQCDLRRVVPAAFDAVVQGAPATAVLHDAEQPELRGEHVLRQHGGILRVGWGGMMRSLHDAAVAVAGRRDGRHGASV